jgi:hypothetical protein
VTALGEATKDRLEIPEVSEVAAEEKNLQCEISLATQQPMAKASFAFALCPLL